MFVGVDVDQQQHLTSHVTGGTCDTRNTMGKGTVLCGYDNLKPIPVPEHTCDQIITVLPVPVSYLMPNSPIYTSPDPENREAFVPNAWRAYARKT